MKIITTEVDVLTGIETVIEREATATEKKKAEAEIKYFADVNAEAEARATARQAIADRLGLTADELQVLLG